MWPLFNYLVLSNVKKKTESQASLPAEFCAWELILSHMFFPKEQHQALLYQLMQQHHHQQHHQPELQQLQMPGPTQIPINNLLAGTQAPPLHPATTNPFLTIHGDGASQKVTVSVFALFCLVELGKELYWLIRDDCL